MFSIELLLHVVKLLMLIKKKLTFRIKTKGNVEKTLSAQRTLLILVVFLFPFFSETLQKRKRVNDQYNSITCTYNVSY